MGRHGRTRGFRVTGTMVAIVVLLIGAIALGIWWWSLRSATDPIDADPVGAAGTVVSSAPCADPAAGHRTVVTLIDVQPVTQSTLDACGYRQGQRLAIEYLNGHPETSRLAGTTTGPPAGGLRRYLPLAILAAGVLAVGATIMLLRDRRRHSRTGLISVTDLQQSTARADPAPTIRPRWSTPTGPVAEAVTDAGTGRIPVYGASVLEADDRQLREHAGDEPLLTHSHRDEPPTG